MAVDGLQVSRSVRRSRNSLALVLAVAAGISPAFAADVVKDNNNVELSQGGSWVGGAVPTGADVALFDGTVTSPLAVDLGGDLTVQLLRVTNPAGAVTINDPTGAFRVITSGGFDLSAATQGLTLNAAVAVAGSQTWSVGLLSALTINGGVATNNTVTINSVGNTAINGVVSGSGSLQKLGTGTLTLAQANTNTGNTTLAQGRIVLDTAAAGAAGLNLLAATTLTLGGSTGNGAGSGALEITGAGTQNFATTVIGSGFNQVTAAPGATLNLGTLTRNAMSGNILTGGGSVQFGTTGTITTASTGQVILLDNQSNAFATYGLADWAGTDANGRVQAATYTDVGSSQGTTSVSAVNITGSFTQSGNGQWRGVRFNNAGSTTVTLSGSTTQSMNGILVTPTSGDVTIAGGFVRVNRSSVTGGTSGAYLPIFQNSTSSVLTIASAVTNGSSSTPVGVLKNGPGRLVLSGSNSFSAGLMINEGTVAVTADANLGSATGGLIFSGGALEAGGTFTNGRTTTLTTRNGAVAVSGANVFTQGGNVVGAGGLTKLGTGTMVLNATANTYSGGTTVGAGTLLANSTIGSSTGTGLVTVASGGTLGGVGTVGGPVAVASGGRLNPGDGIGTLNVNALTLSSGSALDFAFGSGVNDLVNVLNNSALTLGTGITLNLFQADGVTPFAANGVYTLFSGLLTVNGATVVNGRLTNFAPSAVPAGADVAVTLNGSDLVVTITGGAVDGIWNVNGGGSWAASGNWSGGVPNGALDTATFGSILTANGTVALDGDKTVNKLTLNNTAASYTISQGTSGSLVLAANAGSSLVSVSGNHAISAPVQLSADATVNAGAGSTLTMSGPVSGSGTLAATGTGAIVIAGSNTANVSVGAGSLVQVGTGGTAGAIGAGTLAVNGTLRFNKSDDVTLSNTRSGTGTIEQAGGGTLILGGDGGSLGLSIAAGGARLASATGAGTGALSVATGTTLDLNGFSPTVGTLSGGGMVDNVSAGGNVTLTVNQAAASTFSGTLESTTGALSLVKTGSGALTIASAQPLSTDVLISGGSVIANHSNALGSGKVLLNTPGGLGFGDGVNVANHVELRAVGGSVDNFFVNGSATLSGNLTMADPNLNAQMRLAAGTGTLTLLGNVTAPATYANIDNTSTTTTFSPIVMITRGNVIFAGNSVLDSGNIFWFGRSGGNTANITFKDNAQFIGRAGGEAANLGGSSGQNTTSVTMTVQDNAFLNIGRDSVNNLSGVSTFNLNAGGAATTTIVNLNGGSMALAAFTKSAANTTVVNFNGTQLKQGASAGTFLPAFNGTANILTGGLKIATDFNTGIDQPLVGSANDGGIAKSGTGTLTLRAAANYTGATTVTGGAVVFENGPHAIGAVEGTGAVVVDFTSNVTADGIRAGLLQVDGTATIRSSTPVQGASKVGTLAILGSAGAWSGKLDIANNALIVTAGTAGGQAAVIAQLQDQVTSGRAGGTWTGTGITSSAMTDSAFAAVNALAVVDAGDLGLTSYRGQTGLDANSTIVVAAHSGDATLDGKVDAFDLNKLAANWQQGAKSWSTGDFTGDGKVDAFDLNVLAANWQFGSAASLEAALAEFPVFGAAAVSGAIAAVPEPASLAVLALGGAALLGRRRRK